MYKSIAANKRNTIFIMMVFVALIGGIGWAVSYFYGDTSIAYWVVGIAAVYALIQYFAAAKIAVAITGARQIEKRDNPRFYRIVENLAITTGMPTPKVYIIDDPAPNAFATGRNPQTAIVAATSGLIDMMDDNELEAVMAHEMGHIQNYDIRLSMITFGLVSAIGLIADLVLRIVLFGESDNDNKSPIIMMIGFVFIVVAAPIVAILIQMAASRQREYLADATSAMTTRNPDSMISALEKLKAQGRPMQKQNTAVAQLFFASPLKAGFVNKLFSTHPPLQERINKLRESAGKF
ncbi:MAG: M48 family metallopeptidase [Candidatus Saccharibacteria bacterium]